MTSCNGPRSPGRGTLGHTEAWQAWADTSDACEGDYVTLSRPAGSTLVHLRLERGAAADAVAGGGGRGLNAGHSAAQSHRSVSGSRVRHLNVRSQSSSQISGTH